jgi:hypothetical protein
MKHRMLLGLAVIVIAGSYACKGEEGTGPSQNNLPIDLMNFTNAPADIGFTGSPPLTIAGNQTNGNPTRIDPVNPGVGGSFAFTVVQGGQTYNVTCTVTDITNVSVAPQVVLQPGGLSFDCVDW